MSNIEEYKEYFDLSNYNCEITPCDEQIDLSDQEKYKKLELSSSQKMQISALTNSIPNIIATKELASAYSVRFPKGLPHTLTSLKQGGYGTMLRGNDGKFNASASMESLAKQSAILSGFTAMSIISGQYFLKQINSELSTIKNKVEEILSFLNKEKKSDLQAKLYFAQYAYNNYSQIMTNSDQRIATIVNLQQIKITSNANIHFYISFIDTTKANDEDAIDFYSNVITSLDLYILSNLLEICYSQNLEEEYVKNVAKDIEDKIQYTKSQMTNIFAKLQKNENEKGTKWSRIKNNAHGKEHKESRTNKIAEELASDNHPYFKQKKNFTESFINNFNNMKSFYLTQNGSLYLIK